MYVEVNMLRLARYIEHEFDRNLVYFAQAHSRCMASYDFINYIMSDTNIIQLNEEEQKYVEQIKDCYINIASLSNEITSEISKYKLAYESFLLEEDFD